jgi:hypothetical protein
MLTDFVILTNHIDRPLFHQDDGLSDTT